MKKNNKKQKLNIGTIISKTVAAVRAHTHTIHLNNILKKVLNKIMTIIKYGKIRDKYAPLLSHILLWSFSVF